MKALILGYGTSGQSAEKYLRCRGCETVVYDDNGAKPNIDQPFDFCAVSPGINYDHAVIRAMTERDIPIIAEFELPFFCEKVKTKIVAVTGTNGKTTVVNQIYTAVTNAGKSAVLCGNVGTPLSAMADNLRGAVAVTEVSSFMLEPAVRRIKHAALFRPHIAVITNITQDHLERHGTMEEYIRCKKQIFAPQRRRDWLVLNYDDPHCRTIGGDIIKRRTQTKRTAGVPRVLWFSACVRVRGFYCEDGVIYNNMGRKPRPMFRTADANENTPHGILNMLATVCAGHLLKLKTRAVLPAVTHTDRADRIQLVADKNGVAFYNDSKATNIAAALAAVNCFSLPVTLILCGMTKGQDYNELFKKLPRTVTNIIVFGACAPTVLACAEAADYKNITGVKNLSAAVDAAIKKTAAPGIVLFSPAGSSFDMFKNYADRGRQFTKTVSAKVSKSI